METLRSLYVMYRWCSNVPSKSEADQTKAISKQPSMIDVWVDGGGHVGVMSHWSNDLQPKHSKSKMRHHWPPQALIALLQLMVSGSAWVKVAIFILVKPLTIDSQRLSHPQLRFWQYISGIDRIVCQTNHAINADLYPATLPPCLLCLDRMQDFQCHSPWSGDQWRCWPKEPDCDVVMVWPPNRL